MPKEIWVAGFPSFLGGADTELNSNIDLWRKHGVDVHLVPMFGSEQQMQDLCLKRGCHIHEYHPAIFKNKIVVSFCNGEFLKALPDIVDFGRPKTIVWFNCMTWVFPLEMDAHKNGWIDYHGFVSNYQRKWLEPELTSLRPVQALEGYRPYFSPESMPFKYRSPDKWFAVGRISRDDQHKFSSDMWSIFYKVCTPQMKKVLILGFGANAKTKCGPGPQGLDFQTWPAGAIPARQLYGLLHCIIHKTGGSRESYCRIVPEAYAAGVPIVVEDDYAFPDIVVNGVTGFRCKSSDEMSFRASELAFDEVRRKKMILAARDYLENEIASDERCWSAWTQLF